MASVKGLRSFLGLGPKVKKKKKDVAKENKRKRKVLKKGYLKDLGKRYDKYEEAMND